VQKLKTQELIANYYLLIAAIPICYCFYLIRMPPKPLYNAACTNLKTGCRTNGNADSSYDYVFAAY